jgi:hypothetical protein
MPPTTASKKSISNEQWDAKLASVKVAKEDMNRLVMNFLVTEVTSLIGSSNSNWPQRSGMSHVVAVLVQEQEQLAVSTAVDLLPWVTQSCNSTNPELKNISMLFMCACKQQLHATIQQILFAAWGVPRSDTLAQLLCMMHPQGYVDAARMLEQESGTAPGVELGSITDRMEIRKAVQSGQVEEAIDKVNDMNPEVR